MDNSRQLGIFAPIALDVYQNWDDVKNNTGAAVLRSDLATTGPGKGAELVAVRNGYFSTVPRTVDAKARDVWSVKDFGAVGDGVTNDTVAVQNAVSWVGSQGGTLFFPAGSYLVTASIGAGLPSNYSTKGMKIVGSGMSSTRILWGSGSAGAGLYFYMNDQTYPLEISDISLMTYNQGVGVGIQALWPSAAGVSSPAAHIENVQITAPLGVSAWFNMGIELTNAYMSTISNCVIRGNGPGTPNIRSMDRGISLIGTSTDVKVTNTHIYFANRGIHLQDFSEGLNIAQCYIIWVTEGVTGLNGSGAPGFFCSNTHIYAFNHGIYLVGRPQAMIHSNLIYQDPNAVVPSFTGIALSGNSTHGAVHGNFIYAGSPTPSRTAITIDSSNCTVYGNNFISVSTGVNVTSAGSSGYLAFGQR